MSANLSRSTPPLPRVAITVGDVAGVGPELALRCAAMPEVNSQCIPILIGPLAVLGQIANMLDLQLPPVGDLDAEIDSSVVIDIGDIAAESLVAGKFNQFTGQASFDAVDFAIQSAIAQRVDAIVTGPIQKEAWHAAGINFPGHTELLAERTQQDEFCMMLTSETISCVLATIHIPLADVPGALSTENIGRAITLGHDALSRRLGRDARVTVCGLNPHAGENGLFSHGEETAIIEPAIKAARESGIQITGPVPPDTAFTPRMRSTTDVYICMYHDQGLIPLKALSFDDAVNVTLGLPIVRTSVDHGTALDLAWQGKANHESMLAAIRMAIDLS